MKESKPRIKLLLPAFVALIYILWPRFRGAPWVPTPQATAYKMLTLAKVQPGDVVYDLGSGDGRILILAARHFGARAVGIEIDPLRYLWTKLVIAVLGLQQQIRIIRGDLFDHDLGQADVVTCYLLPRTNRRLVTKLGRELRTGTRVVSHRFALPGWPAVRQDSKARIYVYRIGDRSQAQGRDQGREQ